MKIYTEITYNTASDWAKVKCVDHREVRYVDVFVPLATKVYPELSTDAAVAKTARKRFKDDGLSFTGYD